MPSFKLKQKQCQTFSDVHDHQYQQREMQQPETSANTSVYPSFFANRPLPELPVEEKQKMMADKKGEVQTPRDYFQLQFKQKRQKRRNIQRRQGHGHQQNDEHHNGVQQQQQRPQQYHDEHQQQQRPQQYHDEHQQQQRPQQYHDEQQQQQQTQLEMERPSHKKEPSHANKEPRSTKWFHQNWKPAKETRSCDGQETASTSACTNANRKLGECEGLTSHSQLTTSQRQTYGANGQNHDAFDSGKFITSPANSTVACDEMDDDQWNEMVGRVGIGNEREENGSWFSTAGSSRRNSKRDKQKSKYETSVKKLKALNKKDVFRLYHRTKGDGAEQNPLECKSPIAARCVVKANAAILNANPLVNVQSEATNVRQSPSNNPNDSPTNECQQVLDFACQCEESPGLTETTIPVVQPKYAGQNSTIACRHTDGTDGKIRSPYPDRAPNSQSSVYGTPSASFLNTPMKRRGRTIPLGKPAVAQTWSDSPQAPQVSSLSPSVLYPSQCSPGTNSGFSVLSPFARDSSRVSEIRRRRLTLLAEPSPAGMTANKSSPFRRTASLAEPSPGKTLSDKSSPYRRVLLLASSIPRLTKSHSPFRRQLLVDFQTSGHTQSHSKTVSNSTSGVPKLPTVSSVTSTNSHTGSPVPNFPQEGAFALTSTSEAHVPPFPDLSSRLEHSKNQPKAGKPSLKFADAVKDLLTCKRQHANNANDKGNEKLDWKVEEERDEACDDGWTGMNDLARTTVQKHEETTAKDNEDEKNQDPEMMEKRGRRIEEKIRRREKEKKAVEWRLRSRLTLAGKNFVLAVAFDRLDAELGQAIDALGGTVCPGKPDNNTYAVLTDLQRGSDQGSWRLDLRQPFMIQCAIGRYNEDVKGVVKVDETVNGACDEECGSGSEETCVKVPARLEGTRRSNLSLLPPSRGMKLLKAAQRQRDFQTEHAESIITSISNNENSSSSSSTSNRLWPKVPECLTSQLTQREYLACLHLATAEGDKLRVAEHLGLQVLDAGAFLQEADDAIAEVEEMKKKLSHRRITRVFRKLREDNRKMAIRVEDVEQLYKPCYQELQKNPLDQMKLSLAKPPPHTVHLMFTLASPKKDCAAEGGSQNEIILVDTTNHSVSCLSEDKLNGEKERDLQGEELEICSEEAADTGDIHATVDSEKKGEKGTISEVGERKKDCTSLDDSKHRVAHTVEDPLSSSTVPKRRHKYEGSVPKFRRSKESYCSVCEQTFTVLRDHVETRAHRKKAVNCETYQELNEFLDLFSTVDEYLMTLESRSSFQVKEIKLQHSTDTPLHVLDSCTDSEKILADATKFNKLNDNTNNDLLTSEKVRTMPHEKLLVSPSTFTNNSNQKRDGDISSIEKTLEAECSETDVKEALQLERKGVQIMWSSELEASVLQPRRCFYPDLNNNREITFDQSHIIDSQAVQKDEEQPENNGKDKSICTAVLRRTERRNVECPSVQTPSEKDHSNKKNDDKQKTVESNTENLAIETRNSCDISSRNFQMCSKRTATEGKSVLAAKVKAAEDVSVSIVPGLEVPEEINAEETLEWSVHTEESEGFAVNSETESSGTVTISQHRVSQGHAANSLTEPNDTVKKSNTISHQGGPADIPDSDTHGVTKVTCKGYSKSQRHSTCVSASTDKELPSETACDSKRGTNLKNDYIMQTNLDSDYVENRMDIGQDYNTKSRLEQQQREIAEPVVARQQNDSAEELEHCQHSALAENIATRTEQQLTSDAVLLIPVSENNAAIEYDCSTEVYYREETVGAEARRSSVEAKSCKPNQEVRTGDAGRNVEDLGSTEVYFQEGNIIANNTDNNASRRFTSKTSQPMEAVITAATEHIHIIEQDLGSTDIFLQEENNIRNNTMKNAPQGSKITSSKPNKELTATDHKHTDTDDLGSTDIYFQDGWNMEMDTMNRSSQCANTKSSKPKEEQSTTDEGEQDDTATEYLGFTEVYFEEEHNNVLDKDTMNTQQCFKTKEKEHVTRSEDENSPITQEFGFNYRMTGDIHSLKTHTVQHVDLGSEDPSCSEINSYVQFSQPEPYSPRENQQYAQTGTPPASTSAIHTEDKKTCHSRMDFTSGCLSNFCELVSHINHDLQEASDTVAELVNSFQGKSWQQRVESATAEFSGELQQTLSEEQGECVADTQQLEEPRRKLLMSESSEEEDEGAVSESQAETSEEGRSNEAAETNIFTSERSKTCGEEKLKDTAVLSASDERSVIFKDEFNWTISATQNSDKRDAGEQGGHQKKRKGRQTSKEPGITFSPPVFGRKDKEDTISEGSRRDLKMTISFNSQRGEYFVSRSNSASLTSSPLASECIAFESKQTIDGQNREENGKDGEIMDSFVNQSSSWRNATVQGEAEISGKPQEYNTAKTASTGTDLQQIEGDSVFHQQGQFRKMANLHHEQGLNNTCRNSGGGSGSSKRLKYNGSNSNTHEEHSTDTNTNSSSSSNKCSDRDGDDRKCRHTPRKSRTNYHDNAMFDCLDFINKSPVKKDNRSGRKSRRSYPENEILDCPDFGKYPPGTRKAEERTSTAKETRSTRKVQLSSAVRADTLSGPTHQHNNIGPSHHSPCTKVVTRKPINHNKDTMVECIDFILQSPSEKDAYEGSIAKGKTSAGKTKPGSASPRKLSLDNAVTDPDRMTKGENDTKKRNKTMSSLNWQATYASEKGEAGKHCVEDGPTNPASQMNEEALNVNPVEDNYKTREASVEETQNLQQQAAGLDEEQAGLTRDEVYEHRHHAHRSLLAELDAMDAHEGHMAQSSKSRSKQHHISHTQRKAQKELMTFLPGDTTVNKRHEFQADAPLMTEPKYNGQMLSACVQNPEESVGGNHEESVGRNVDRSDVIRMIRLENHHFGTIPRNCGVPHLEAFSARRQMCRSPSSVRSGSSQNASTFSHDYDENVLSESHKELPWSASTVPTASNPPSSPTIAWADQDDYHTFYETEENRRKTPKHYGGDLAYERQNLQQYREDEADVYDGVGINEDFGDASKAFWDYTDDGDVIYTNGEAYVCEDLKNETTNWKTMMDETCTPGYYEDYHNANFHSDSQHTSYDQKGFQGFQQRVTAHHSWSFQHLTRPQPGRASLPLPAPTPTLGYDTRYLRSPEKNHKFTTFEHHSPVYDNPLLPQRWRPEGCVGLSYASEHQRQNLMAKRQPQLCDRRRGDGSGEVHPSLFDCRPFQDVEMLDPAGDDAAAFYKQARANSSSERLEQRNLHTQGSSDSKKEVTSRSKTRQHKREDSNTTYERGLHKGDRQQRKAQREQIQEKEVRKNDRSTAERDLKNASQGKELDKEIIPSCKERRLRTRGVLSPDLPLFAEHKMADSQNAMLEDDNASSVHPGEAFSFRRVFRCAKNSRQPKLRS